MDVLPRPGLSTMKANECQNKLMPLVPQQFKYYYERMTESLQRT